jgi:cytochrome c-type biogenesis protein CcmH
MTGWRALALIVLVVIGAGGLSRADDAPLQFADPALAARYEALTRELRCLVCQNQTIADSHATLAGDLRREVREQLERGASDAEIISFMTARYGDYVLYRPPVTATTLLLWAGPFLLLGLALALWWRAVRRRSMDADDGGRA